MLETKKERRVTLHCMSKFTLWFGAAILATVAVILTAGCAGKPAFQRSFPDAAHTSKEGIIPDESTPADAPGAAYQRQYFAVKFPPGVHAEVKKGPDFDIHIIAIEPDNHVILNAIDSSFPRFPLEAPSTAAQRKSMVNGSKLDSYVWTTDKGACRESLAEIGQTEFGVPLLVHFIYMELNATDAQVADSIINSVKRKTGGDAPH